MLLALRLGLLCEAADLPAHAEAFLFGGICRFESGLTTVGANVGNRLLTGSDEDQSPLANTKVCDHKCKCWSKGPANIGVS